MAKVKPWSPKRLQEWRHIRTKGESRFVWLHGVLQWGGFMYCFTLSIYQVRYFGDLFSIEGNLPFRLVFGAVSWAFVGYLYGRSKWRRNEREYWAQVSGDSD